MFHVLNSTSAKGSVLLLAMLILSACPASEDPEVNTPARDMSTGSMTDLDTTPIDFGLYPQDMNDLDMALVDMPEQDAQQDVDANEDMSNPDMTMTDMTFSDDDMGEVMPEDMPADMPTTMVPSYEEVPQKSVEQVFPGLQPGALPPTRTLRVFYSSDLQVYVGLDPLSGWSVQEVEQVFISLQRFKDLLPETYLPLFELSNYGSTTYLHHPQNASWTNTNATNAFVVISNDFQSQGAVMASNFYALGDNQGSIYVNVPFLNIRPDVIDGGFQGVGPQPIYPNLSASQARDRYLQEGLADSLIHERIHAFISQFYAHDRLFSALRDNSSCGYQLEEFLVRQHLNYFYDQHPGLFSQEHQSYWASDFQILSNNVQQSSCYQTLIQQGLLDSMTLHIPVAAP